MNRFIVMIRYGNQPTNPFVMIPYTLIMYRVRRLIVAGVRKHLGQITTAPLFIGNEIHS